MKLSDFQYHLPPELIATHPAERRDASRLMRLDRAGGAVEHHVFSDLPGLLRPGDCLVINDSRVIPARVWAERRGGGRTELLLIAPGGEGVWEALARPARRLVPGTRLTLPGNAGEVEVIGGEGRSRLVRFHTAEPLEQFLARAGEMPLPPYILRERQARGEAPHATEADRERYQTVYAREQGSIAAPTAGLHFTPELLAEIEKRGIEIRRVTLHVGIGTFEPIEVDDLADHKMHTELYEISAENAAAIEAARIDPDRRVVAVGTTAIRTLESCAARHGRIQADADSTALFIQPGFKFQVIGAMVTNFHLPASTLLILISAFAGRENVLAAYAEAVREKYRFFSYGDAMLIE
ncbi:MAG: tRNA preQ1(34) S-adenosylmethionine ribosyltransferase-isomerase QueA [Candidatus Sumerlaeia bacterium]